MLSVAPTGLPGRTLGLSPSAPPGALLTLGSSVPARRRPLVRNLRLLSPEHLVLASELRPAVRCPRRLVRLLSEGRRGPVWLSLFALRGAPGRGLLGLRATVLCSRIPRLRGLCGIGLRSSPAVGRSASLLAARVRPLGPLWGRGSLPSVGFAPVGGRSLLTGLVRPAAVGPTPLAPSLVGVLSGTASTDGRPRHALTGGRAVGSAFQFAPRFGALAVGSGGVVVMHVRSRADGPAGRSPGTGLRASAVYARSSRRGPRSPGRLAPLALPVRSFGALARPVRDGTAEPSRASARAESTSTYRT